MWTRLHQNEELKRRGARRHYMEVYEAAKEQHLTNYRDDLEGRARLEQEAKESLWKPE